MQRINGKEGEYGGERRCISLGRYDNNRHRLSKAMPEVFQGSWLNNCSRVQGA